MISILIDIKSLASVLYQYYRYAIFDTTNPTYKISQIFYGKIKIENTHMLHLKIGKLVWFVRMWVQHLLGFSSILLFK